MKIMSNDNLEKESVQNEDDVINEEHIVEGSILETEEGTKDYDEHADEYIAENDLEDEYLLEDIEEELEEEEELAKSIVSTGSRVDASSVTSALPKQLVQLDHFIQDSTSTISGDFVVKEDNAGDVLAFNIGDYEEIGSEMIEEENEVEEEENKEELIITYQQLLEEKRQLRRKNLLLHRKLTEYLRRRNLDKLLIEPETTDGVDLQEKYERKLMALSYTLEVNKEKKNKMQHNIEKIKSSVEHEQQLLDGIFSDFIKRQRDLTIGAINTKTGKVLPDKVVERILSLQQSKIKTIGELRLLCIRIRDKVAIKEASLKCVETLGENLHLVDYEQLRLENQNYGDKIEERDEELCKLRDKSTVFIQTLAHIREKNYAIAVEIHFNKEKLSLLNNNLAEERETLNKLKLERDGYRSEANNLRQKSGLLTQTKLLYDFELTNELVVQTEEELKQIKQNYQIEKQELIDIRKYLESFETGVEYIMKPKPERAGAIRFGGRYYKHRPLLPRPSLPVRKKSSKLLKQILTTKSS